MRLSLRSFGTICRSSASSFIVLFLMASLPGPGIAMPTFLRANSNSDAQVDISDALYTLGFLFAGGPEPACDDAADANDDGEIDISDGLYTLSFLFLGSATPPPPGPDSPGPDPTPDDLICGPELLCDSPPDGALVDLVPGAGVTVRGTARGLSDVQVNGVPVTVAADHTFTATVAGRFGLNIVEITGTDRSGATRTELCMFLGAERWLAEGAQLDEALVFRVEPPGFEKLTSPIPAWLNAEISPRLDRFLVGANPLLDMNCGFLGTCVTEIRYLGLSMTLDSVNLTVTNANAMNVRVQLDLSLRLRVRSQSAGIPRSVVEGEVRLTNAVVDLGVSLGVNAVTGRPHAEGMRVNSIDLSGVSTQFPGLDGEFIGTVVSVAQDIVMGRLGTELLGGASGLFEGLFAGMEVTLPAAGFSVGRLDGTGNVTVALETKWSVSLRNNGLTVLCGLRLPATLPPAATVRVPLPLAPSLETGLARPGTDAWSAAHAGVFNQVLHTLWRAGLFDGVVDGAALDPGLPAGTSLSVQLRAMPVVTGFGPGGMIGLDVGGLEVVVSHPGLPPGLRVIAGARVSARASLSDDLVFDDIAMEELRISTGATTLTAASRGTVQGLLERLLRKLAGVALNDSLPVMPAIVVTIPPSLGDYGLPVGSSLIGIPRLVIEANRVFLEGSIGLGP